ncbi:hypothetical protein KK2020170_12600 [Flavobacterium okayamense]|uniref:Sensory transduction regulator n=2 Tax=Flavobacterium okayamense TaxID=2830782 RepID=A0ABM7S6T4_9FLAO|nr:hypothetical protein KK2020170_12600 [Flavobacterium okayamense]
MLFASIGSFAQRVVSPEDLTSQLLKETFDNAYIEVLEVKDTYVKVKDVFNVYMDIDKSKRYIAFNSTYNLVEGTSPAKALALMNKLNAEVALIKAYYTESSNTITYYYYFWTDGGFTQKSLVSALKLYKTALNLSLDKDTEKLIK